MNSDGVTQLDQLVGNAIASFDIPDELYQLAVSRYEDVGAWLSEYSDKQSGGEVYPQGSFRLGTVVRPIVPTVHYDIDLVCRRNLSKAFVSQAQLKLDVGNGLKVYVSSLPEGHPTLGDGKRCWTLEYPHDPFHMDILPAIPDPEGAANAILLTDKELREWQHSNPIDFAEWFYRRMETEFAERRKAAAEIAKAMDVADVPAWKVKTTLQRTVQALKRHRDMFFAETPDARPASIIITTLAAQSYRGGGSLYEVLVNATAVMPGLVERRNGTWWIANPVQPEENFADRWRDNNRAEVFFRWIGQAHEDFVDYGREMGIQHALGKIAKSLGSEASKSAGERLGSGFINARQAGQLGVGTSGLLTTAARRPMPQHTFHGDAAFRHS